MGEGGVTVLAVATDPGALAAYTVLLTAGIGAAVIGFLSLLKDQETKP